MRRVTAAAAAATATVAIVTQATVAVTRAKAFSIETRVNSGHFFWRALVCVRKRSFRFDANYAHSMLRFATRALIGFACRHSTHTNSPKSSDQRGESRRRRARLFRAKTHPRRSTPLVGARCRSSTGLSAARLANPVGLRRRDAWRVIIATSGSSDDDDDGGDDDRRAAHPNNPCNFRSYFYRLFCVRRSQKPFLICGHVDICIFLTQHLTIDAHARFLQSTNHAARVRMPFSPRHRRSSKTRREPMLRAL